DRRSAGLPGAGELRHWRTAALPAIAAAGGMIVPALAYVAIAGGGPDSRGWGIPMATDIAFVLGVAGLLGRRVPQQLRLFLLTLAIVDDVGAILVIAIVYSEGVDGGALLVAVGLVAGFVALRRAGVSVLALDVAVGVGLWLALHDAGVHPTLAGVVMGLLAPARPAAAASVAKEWANDLSDDPAPAELRTMTAIAHSAQPVVDRIAHALHPLTSWLVVPLFGLANAGVVLSGGLGESSGRTVALAVAAGLVVGKLVGITAASALAVRLGLGRLPAGLAWGHVVGGAMLAGIGFTVSLFVADLAFAARPLVDGAKVGILMGSTAAAVAGAALLVVARRRQATA
ncbi:MAG: Na+/H+ antiporter NhaA, partial [Chloroflexi bacterium]|nr:Na+/H+ antiporter NhaA [Chloroflexota bacterium]